MNTTKMSAAKFCKFALLFSNLSLPELAGMVKDECLPEMAEIAAAARDMADGLTPSEHTLAAHAFLHELAEAAEDRSLQPA